MTLRQFLPAGALALGVFVAASAPAFAGPGYVPPRPAQKPAPASPEPGPQATTCNCPMMGSSDMGMQHQCVQPPGDHPASPGGRG